MRKLRLLYLAILIVAFQTSCRSPKDILMFQEEDTELNYFQVPRKPTEHKIKPYDNLYLSVSTLDPEVNTIFNPNAGGGGLTSGTQQMYGDPSSQYINGHMVTADSLVTLPIIGDINLVGLTLDQAEEKLRAKAEVYLKQPTVQVKFLNYKVNVLGEIKNPGLYYNYEGNINIYEAISMASGITDFANLHNVVVKRYNQNKIATFNVNLTDNSVYLSEVFYLQPNDIVYIPPSKLKRRRENSDTYGKIISTLSTILVAAALVITNTNN